MTAQSPVSRPYPSWITEDFIQETLRAWQRYSKTPLTHDDAVEIIVNVSNLVDALRLFGDQPPTHPPTPPQ